MPVDFSIKRVPDKVARRLRDRAKGNHRSVQGELMAILQDALESKGHSAHSDVVRERAAPGSSTYKWKIAPQSESALMIRETRDGRTFTVEDLLNYVSRFPEGTPDEATAWIRQSRSSR